MDSPKCKFQCEEIKKLKKAIEVLKKENEMLKKDKLLSDFNVFNRHYLDELLKEEYFPKLENKEGWFYNVALMDLDNLHNINREKGYEFGDIFIKNTIKKIKNIIEETKASGRIFRIGGDEFLIIYQPYDYVDFDLINDITFAIGTFNSKESFKNEIKNLDEIIISKKSLKKNSERK